MSGISRPLSSRLVASAQRRRFRDDQSLPLPVWNGIFEHRRAIGSAVWEFLWCIDKTTRERSEADGSKTGLVLGGKPVSAEEIGRDLDGKDPKAVRANLDRLEKNGYIRRPLRTPYGYTIEVLRSEKRGYWQRPERTGENARSLATSDRVNSYNDGAKTPERTGESTRSRSDIAVDLARNRAAAPSSVSLLNRPSGCDDDLFHTLYGSFKGRGVCLSKPRFDWAVALIKARTTCRVANPDSYWRKSLQVFFENSEEEMRVYLSNKFIEISGHASDYASAVEELKCLVTQHDLPYPHAIFDAAVDSATREIERQVGVGRELRVGAFSRPAAPGDAEQPVAEMAS